MLHQIVTGGYEFIPFARSRIAALKKLGLAYADQSFEINGASIRVRIEPGHEYIRIDGGGVSLAMDSGAVTFGDIGAASIWRDDPGYLFDVGSSVAYHAKFVKKNDQAIGRTNPGRTSDGQIAGTVTSGNPFKGLIAYDEDMAQWFPNMAGTIPANCLSPKWEQLTDGSYRPLGAIQTEDSYGDTTLFNKKLIIAICPASVFTGKMRLYVQSMYGLPLYNYVPAIVVQGGTRNLSSKKQLNRPITSVVTGMSSAPALMLTPYVASDDFVLDDAGNPTSTLNTYSEVMIDTSSGVYLDETTGRHFLIQINNTNVNIFQLVSTKVGEALRGQLIRANSTLSEIDREHLEAYILAWALPDVKNVQRYPGAAQHPAYSMGYGWHWNWSGTMASIVTLEVDAGPTSSPFDNTMSSTMAHLDVTIQRIARPQDGWQAGDIRQTWDISLTKPEENNLWTVPRSWHCIVEPNFATMTLMKTTEKDMQPVACDAPIYAFYERDVLMVLRVKCNRIETGPPIRTMSPDGFWSDTPLDYSLEGNTLGEGDGWGEDNWRSTYYYDYTFSLGDFSTDTMPHAKHTYGYRVEVRDKTKGAEAGPKYSSESGWYGTLPIGYPDSQGNYAQTSMFGSSDDRARSMNHGYYFQWTWTTAHMDTHEEVYGDSEIVVPFHDSQAVYIHAITQTTTWRENEVASYHDTLTLTNWDAGWAVRQYVYPYSGGTLGPYDYYQWSNAKTPNAVVENVVQPDPSIGVQTKMALVCVAGSVPFTFPTSGIGNFHANNEEEVGTQFSTRSATSVASPAVYATQTSVSIGHPAGDDPYTYVGWV